MAESERERERGKGGFIIIGDKLSTTSDDAREPLSLVSAMICVNFLIHTHTHTHRQHTLQLCWKR